MVAGMLQMSIDKYCYKHL